MLDFQPIDLARRAEYNQFLYGCGRGCEFNFTNIYLWGRQCAAFHEGNLVDPPATMVNAAGDYVVSYIVERFVTGKDWLQKKIAEKKVSK